MESASFADTIKGTGFSDQADWHFVDTPFFDGYETSTNPQQHNLTWAIQAMHDQITNPSGHGTAPKSYPVDVDFSRSFNLRLLIHYVGDIHQPLHSVSRYTAEFPDGDRGGNSFLLPKMGEVSNLHSLWDSVMNMYADFE